MDKDALYWLLSTLPQVAAALVAFVGFLGLQRIEQISQHKASIERRARGFDSSIYEKGKFKTGQQRDLELMSGVEFMLTLKASLPDIPDNGWHKYYCNEWTPLYERVEKLQKQLNFFALKNVTVIVISLVALPFIPLIDAAGPFTRAFVVGISTTIAIYIAISARRMIRAALNPSAT